MEGGPVDEEGAQGALAAGGSSSAPSSSSPLRPPSAASISRWPSSVLLEIFLQAVEPGAGDSAEWIEQREEDVCGGVLARWRSTVVLKPLALVCRGWRDAATTALYRSISITSPANAHRLLDTLRAHHSRRGKVKRLSVGLSDSRFVTQASEHDLVAASQAMVHVVELCHNLSSLQVLPLHKHRAPDLLAVLQPLQDSLTTLVLGPRLWKDVASLCPLGSRHVELLVRRLRRVKILELNCSSKEPGEKATPWHGPVDTEPRRPLRLKKLGIYTELDDEILEGLLSEASELEVLDVYKEEHLRLVDRVRKAMLASAKTMKSLRFFVNPIFQHDPNGGNHGAGSTDGHAVLFNEELLPHYRQLGRLHLCNALVSPTVFRHLPSTGSLKYLSIHSLAPASQNDDHFRFTPQLLDDLKLAALTPALDALETFRIQDVRSDWGEETIQAVREALEARNVVFKFEEDNDGSSAGSSGSPTGSAETSVSRSRSGSGDGSRDGSRTGSGASGSMTDGGAVSTSSDPVMGPPPGLVDGPPDGTSSASAGSASAGEDER
ncbi:hypothetical protein JCM8097_008871 [Rhodosporidiobolus ruineniae]